MKLFMEELKNRSEEDLLLIQKWYQLDENALPPEYILKVSKCLLVRCVYYHIGASLETFIIRVTQYLV